MASMCSASPRFGETVQAAWGNGHLPVFEDR